MATTQNPHVTPLESKAWQAGYEGRALAVIAHSPAERAYIDGWRAYVKDRDQQPTQGEAPCTTQQNSHN